MPVEMPTGTAIASERKVTNRAPTMNERIPNEGCAVFEGLQSGEKRKCHQNDARYGYERRNEEHPLEARLTKTLKSFHARTSHIGESLGDARSIPCPEAS
jgi:hypothetical protein